MERIRLILLQMKKGTRIAAILALSAGMLTISACGNKGGNNEDKPAKDLKVGLITLHSHEESTYDKNFYDSMVAAQKKLGFDLVVRLAEEDETCYNTAKALADDGCDIIMADSFGHEGYMIQAAREYPDVQFCHATGTQAAGVNLPNFHDAFAAIYEGRYLAGVVAGQKMAEDIAAGKYTADQAVIGYVGAHPYAEVISGFTSFYLGARSVVPTATMFLPFCIASFIKFAFSSSISNSSECILCSKNVFCFLFINNKLACSAIKFCNIVKL